MSPLAFKMYFKMILQVQDKNRDEKGQKHYGHVSHGLISVWFI